MEHLFGSIPAIVGDLEANGRVDAAMVFAAWSRCAGEQLNACTRPVEYRHQRLLVAVRDENWQKHLRGLNRQMVLKLNSTLGREIIRSVEFKVSPADVAKKGFEARGDEEATGNEIPSSLVTAAESIRDESLRASFLAAAADYIVKQAEYGR